MKRLNFVSSLLSVIALAACGGEGTHTSDTPSAAGTGAAAGGSEQSQQAGRAGQGGAGGALAAGGGAGERSGGAGGANAGSMNAGSGGLGGAGGHAGSAGSGGQGGSGMITTPEALVPIAQSFCAAARSCCMKEQMPTMLDDCESGYAGRDDTAKALARGTVTLDSAGLSRCLAAYQAAADKCEEVGVIAACRGVVHGTRAEGESCSIGSECAGDEAKACLLADSNPGTVGVCRKIPHGKAGDSCEITCRPDENCTWTSYGAAPDQPPAVCFEAEGVYCDRSGDAPRCEPIHAVGTACTDFNQCGSAGDCDLDTQTCKALGKLGEACGRCIPQLTCKDGKCQSPSFTAGPTCDGVSFGPY